MVEKIELYDDPTAPITRTEAAVFGVDAKRHPILGFPLQQGSYDMGRPSPVELQVANYLRAVERDHGRVVANALRAKLKPAGAV